jgi:choline dehydrogenase-like flavoprotein
MICDLMDFPDGSVLEADVVVIGAGPAGIALAHELGSTQIAVVLVESGGLDSEPASQELNEVENVGLPHLYHRDGRARAFGGAGTLWAGQCLPLDAIDFTVRPWVPFSGWPFDRAEIECYYKRAEKFFRVEGVDYDDRVYTDFDMQSPQYLAAKLAPMFTVYTPEVNTGTAWKSRISSSPNIRLVLHATLTEIAVEPSGKAVSHLQVQALDGRRAKVRGGHVVLCAGGLENARLLLLSRRQQSAGLGNSNDQVGRFFMEHPNGFTAEIEASEADAANLQQKFRLLYGGNGRRYFPKIRLGAQTQTSAEVLNCNASLLFHYPENSGIAALQDLFRATRERRMPDKFFQKFANLLRQSPDVIHAVLLRMRSGRSPSGKPSRIQLQCYLEQAPTPHSRVFLSEKKDRFGLPLLALDWRMTELELKTLRVLTSTIQSEFSRLELGRVRAAEWLSQSSGWEANLVDCAHHCGTTRMSDTPRLGVVDSSCQVFGIDGLYVSGSSVFPTSGYANPTLTIVALSIRLADHIKATLSL